MGIDIGPIEASQTLALNFDAANTRSYPGSGTTIIGLVGGIGFTLINGVGFGTSGTNYFTFDGVDDNIPFSIPNVSTGFALGLDVMHLTIVFYLLYFLKKAIVKNAQ